MHRPVLLQETLDGLELSTGKVIVDCTVGLGGHAEAILERIAPGGMLIGLDKDSEALEIAKERLNKFEGSFKLVNDGFENLRQIFEKLGSGKVDGFLFDLGVSSLQLDKPEKGFSFRYDAPLDMRMSGDAEVTAAHIVNRSSEAELNRILKDYGEERFHRRIAKAVVETRKRRRIETTGELVDVILSAVPYKGRHGRIHPATRTFQALRIAVNNELEVLENALGQAIDLLKKSGLICVISYHSLEDRIVKNKLKEAKAKGILELVHKKPLVPIQEEIEENPRSRSAKLRLARRKG